MSRRTSISKDPFSFIKPYRLPKGISFVPPDREHYCSIEINTWINIRLKNCIRTLGLTKITKDADDESTLHTFTDTVLELRLLEEYYHQIYVYYITGVKDDVKLDLIRHLCNNIDELYSLGDRCPIDLFCEETSSDCCYEVGVDDDVNDSADENYSDDDDETDEL